MFNLEFGILISKRIIIMFIILIIGAVCYAKGLITKEGTKQLSNVELKVVNPLLIFMSYQKDYDSKMTHNLIWAFALSAISFAITIALSYLLVSKKSHGYIVERFSVVYSNCGFIGIPLINGIFGSEGVLYLTAYVTFFNLLVWTHGLMSMKQKADFSSAVKAFKSLSVIAVFVGLLCYIFQLKLPSLPSQAFQYIADMNAPLAMLIAGATAAQSNILSVFKKPRNHLICMYKLLLVPIITFVIIRLFNVPTIVTATITIASACPVATTGIMFAITLDKDAEKCSELFTMSTLLSLITLPVITIISTSF
ncbi:MAG: AEC family transporter [Oscillospiraceae bacterium]